MCRWPGCWGRHHRLLVPDAARQISRLFQASISGFSVGFTKLVLPSPEEAPKLYNLTAVLVLLFAVSWPFMASRAAPSIWPPSP